MSHRFRGVLTIVCAFSAVLAACGGGDDGGNVDATALDAPATDATDVDAPATDATDVDATDVDAGDVDAGTDAAMADAGADAMTDAGVDAMTDAGVDAMTDAMMPMAGEVCQMPELITLSGGLGTTTVNGTTAGYLNDYEPPTACTDFLQDGPDHVYEISVPAGARLLAEITGSGGHDPGIYLVATPAAMCDASPIVCLDGDDSGTAATVNSVAFANTTNAATSIFIIADGTATTGGAYAIAVTVDMIPTGDTCQTAETITIPGGQGTMAVNATTLAYANDYQPLCANINSGGADRVHVVSVPAGSRLSATVTPGTSGYDPGVYLVAGPAAACDAATIACVGAADREGDGAAETAVFHNDGGGAVDVYVIVDGFRPAGDTYTLSVTVDAIPTAPAGDTCQLAEGLTLVNGMATVLGTTATASAYYNDYNPLDSECTGFREPGNDRVYAVDVAAGERLTATVTPTATTFDVALYLVAGPAATCDADPLTCLDAFDDGLEGDPETVEFDNTTGSTVTVQLVVDSIYTGGDAFMLDVAVAAIPPAAAGDTCQLAETVTLSGGMATFDGTTETASGYVNDYEPPSACTSGFGEDGNDRVYVVNVPAAGVLTATVTGTGGFDPGIYLIEGPAAQCDANPIVCLDGADDTGGDGVETVTYTNGGGSAVDVMIVVDSYSPSEEGTYTLLVQVQ